jgi:hypothetical protein
LVKINHFSVGYSIFIERETSHISFPFQVLKTRMLLDTAVEVEAEKTGVPAPLPNLH